MTPAPAPQVVYAVAASYVALRMLLLDGAGAPSTVGAFVAFNAAVAVWATVELRRAAAGSQAAARRRSSGTTASSVSSAAAAAVAASGRVAWGRPLACAAGARLAVAACVLFANAVCLWGADLAVLMADGSPSAPAFAMAAYVRAEAFYMELLGSPAAPNSFAALPHEALWVLALPAVGWALFAARRTRAAGASAVVSTVLVTAGVRALWAAKAGAAGGAPDELLRAARLHAASWPFIVATIATAAWDLRGAAAGRRLLDARKVQ